MKKSYGYRIAATELENINKIGILCWGLIGDVFFRVPIIEALKKRFPKANITVIVDPAGKAVLENHPDCDEIYVLSRKKKPLLRYLVQTSKGVAYLRKKKFDLFVNLYSGGSSPLITRLIDARIRLGFDHTVALRKSNNLLVHTPSFCQHWTKALAKKLEPLGIPVTDVRRGSSFYISDHARHVVEKYNLNCERHVAINLGAGKKEKCWPVECYVQLARQITDKYHLVPVMFTNPGMEYLADEFSAQYQGEMVRLPVLSLDEVAAVMTNCKLVVTGDTSLMHLAIGLKVPNMVLFTDTRPEIVEPDDCLHVPCFIEDKARINSCGLPSGTIAIPVDYAMSCFARLMHQIISYKQ